MPSGLPEAQSLETLYRSPGVFLGLFHCRLPAGPRGPEEAAFAHEIVFPRAGVFVKEVAGRKVVADPNQVLFFNRGEPYRVSHPLEGGDDCLVLSLRDEDLLDLLAQRDPAVRDRPGAPFRTRDGPCRPRTARRQAELFAQLRRGDAVPLAVEETAFALLEEAVDSLEGGAPAGPLGAATERRHAEIVAAAQVLLGERFRDRLRLRDLSDAVGCPPFHLCRIFRRHTGQAIHRYLLGLRLRAALLRVTGGERDLSGLALALGFADHSHLTNAFRREFGVSPSELRRKTRGAALRDALERLSRPKGR